MAVGPCTCSAMAVEVDMYGKMLRKEGHLHIGKQKLCIVGQGDQIPELFFFLNGSEPFMARRKI